MEFGLGNANARLLSRVVMRGLGRDGAVRRGSKAFGGTDVVWLVCAAELSLLDSGMR